jgi:hypothetical protein
VELCDRQSLESSRPRVRLAYELLEPMRNPNPSWRAKKVEPEPVKAQSIAQRVRVSVTVQGIIGMALRGV